MSLPKVITDLDDKCGDEFIKSLLRGKVELLTFSTPSGTLVDAIFTYAHPPVNGEHMDRWKGIKVIANYGVGIDHINFADAKRRGIPVGNTPGVLDGATADTAFALLLATGRHLARGDRIARSPEFTTFNPGLLLGQEVHHATVGIIGMGSIGHKIAQRANGFDMKVLYYNRSRSVHESRLGATLVPLDQLLQESDYVVLSVPLNASTRGMIGARELGLMKSTACLINVARGAVVDTAALTDALQRNQIYGAGLDVTDPEPLPRDHPLLTLDNVTVLPHLGSATVQTRAAMARLAVENLLKGLASEPLTCEFGRA